MDIASIIQYLRPQRLIADYVVVSATAIFIYDYILTLPDEIKYIWLSPWTYTKLFFLLIRYLAFVDAFIYPVEQMFIDVSSERCELIYPVGMWCMVIQILLSELVLCIRTWAVWGKNKAVGIGLLAVVIAALVSECVILSTQPQTGGFAPPLYPGFRGCYGTMDVAKLWLNYTLVGIVEAVALMLMVVSAVISYRQGLWGDLSRIVHRDGILFYVYLLCLSAGNVVAAIILPPDYRDTTTPLQTLLYSVFTTRIVLNVREASSQGPRTELHGTYLDAPIFAQIQRVPDSTNWSQSVTNFEVTDDNDGVTEHIQLQDHANQIEQVLRLNKFGG